jgi:predicted DNA-binding protein with PD1-like motif
MLNAGRVTWSVHPADKARHIVLRASSGEILPDSLAARLRDEQVTTGWLRASGVLTDVELRAFDADLGTLGSTRRIGGPVQVLALEGSIGLVDGEPSFSLRALLARETDRGLETLAGEIASARAVALEVLVTALDDLVLGRSVDGAAGVWLLDSAPSSAEGRPRAAVAPGARGAMPAAPGPTTSSASAAVPPAAWSAALEASDVADREPPRPRAAAAPSGAAGGTPMPARPARPPTDFDVVYPEPGDVVEHFAFGGAEVIKSDGDRLHLKVHKDGRVREIALEMLRVARLPDADDGRRRFKLERRL